MSEDKKIVSFELVEQAAQSEVNEAKLVEWNGVTIRVRNTISLDEMLLFVKNVVESCFDDEANYYPEKKDAALRWCTVAFYTNIELGEDPAAAYDVLCRSSLIETIIPYINSWQIDELTDAIEAKMHYIASVGIQATLKSVNEMIAALSNVTDSFGGVFDSIDKEKLNDMISAFSATGLNEEKLVRAIISQKLE